MPSFFRPALGRTANTAVVALFDEVIDDGLLDGWTRSLTSADDVTLVLLGDAPQEELLARAEPLAAKHGLLCPGSADVAIVRCDSYADERIAAEADLLYSRREISGPLNGLPRVDSPDAVLAAREKRRPKGVFVIGMHRSGTSAMSRLINILGVPLSVPGDLLAPRFDNAAGFWESTVAVIVSNTLLDAFGGTALAPPEFAPGWELDDTLAPLRWESRERLAGVFPTSEWVLKDPRSCLTLPFLRAVLDVEPVVVMPFRNPLEVARSLQARDGIPLPEGMAVWERYVRSSIAVTGGLPVSVHAFEGLVEDPLSHAVRLHGFLSSHGISVGELAGTIAGEVRDFISRHLRHHRHDADELRRVATAEQLALYERLVTAERAGATSARPPFAHQKPRVALHP